MKLSDIKVAVFLVFRYIRGANKWTTTLIFSVMVLTFLNLVVIGGILEGIIVGSLEGLRERALGDVILVPNEGRNFIERTQEIALNLKSDSRVRGVSIRNSVLAEVITNKEYRKVLNKNEKRSSVQVNILGVDPEVEDEVFNLSDFIIEGEYFSDDERNSILVGSGLVAKYSPFGDSVLEDVSPGDFVYVALERPRDVGVFEDDDRTFVEVDNKEDTSDFVFQKYQIKGILRTKSGELDLKILMNKEEIKRFISNPGDNGSIMVARLYNPLDGGPVKKSLIDKGYEKYSDIDTIDEAVGSYLNDIRVTFKTLGTIVGGIGVIVATITIFIIIFVTAAARQRFIGILKGIGISKTSIKLSYMLYALFFAFVGMTIGILLLKFFIDPYFVRNPIDFPFSDGILYITKAGLITRLVIIFLATLLAGYIPANIITKKPAIDAIMGR